MASLARVGIYSDGGGLYLRVRPSGRSWVFIGTLNGKRQEMGLGSDLDVTLAQAREKAAAARALVLEGKHPKESRAKAIVAVETPVNFGVFAKDWVASVEDGFRNPKHPGKLWARLQAGSASPFRIFLTGSATGQ